MFQRNSEGIKLGANDNTTYIKNFQPLHVCSLISRTVFKDLNLNMNSKKGNFYVWCTLKKYTCCIWGSNKTRKWMILKYLSKTNRPTHNRFYQQQKRNTPTRKKSSKVTVQRRPIIHNSYGEWIESINFHFSEFGVSSIQLRRNQIGKVSKRGCDQRD